MSMAENTGSEKDREDSVLDPTGEHDEDALRDVARKMQIEHHAAPPHDDPTGDHDPEALKDVARKMGRTQQLSTGRPRARGTKRPRSRRSAPSCQVQELGHKWTEAEARGDVDVRSVDVFPTVTRRLALAADGPEAAGVGAATG